MTDADLVQLREELGAGVRRHRSTGVIVDVAMLDVMDSFAVRTLRGIAQMVKLLGAECIVVGIQPDVAFSMVQLGSLISARLLTSASPNSRKSLRRTSSCSEISPLGDEPRGFIELLLILETVRIFGICEPR